MAADAILAEVARNLWKQDDDGADCPPEQIPTEAQLCEWLAEVPTTTAKEVSARLDALLGDPYYEGGTRAWTIHQRDGAPVLAAIVQYPDDVSAFAFDLVYVHQKWAEQDRPRPKHPLGPIVRAWQDRPTPIEPDRRSKPLAPRTMLEGIDREAPPAPVLELVEVPGLMPYQSDLFRPERGDVPALLKTLYELETDMPGRRGRAPMVAVLWLEGLLSIDTKFRDGRRHVLTFTRKELYRDWAGCDPRNWNHREAEKQTKALLRMNSTAVAVGEGLYVPLIVRAFEGPQLNHRISVETLLPPEAQQGPAVPRRILRALVPSKLSWLGFLSLCAHFDRYGSRRGHLIAATRPEVKRDELGQILNDQGQPIRDKRGAVSKKWSDPRAVRTGQREANPERTRYPALSRDELIALIYPLDPPTSSQDERNKWKATQAALERMESAGGTVIERTPAGWRLMPGPWSFAAHEPLT